MNEIKHMPEGNTAITKGHLRTKPHTILIVDNEVHICTMLSKVLTAEGYHVRTATSGAQALDIVRQEPIGLMLLDLRMPGMSGIQVLQEIKQIDESIVVIMMTGYGALDTAREAMRLGAYDYITKPIDQAFLIQVLSDAAKEETAPRRGR